MIPLFIYGTLKRQFRNSYSQRLKQEGNFIGAGSLTGKLFSLDDYPGAIYEENCTSLIFGEVFEITENQLYFLDEYEEYDPNSPETSEFIRQQRSISIQNKEITCWVYLYNKPYQNLRPICSGIF